jgi:hypothetical protein
VNTCRTIYASWGGVVPGNIQSLASLRGVRRSKLTLLPSLNTCRPAHASWEGVVPGNIQSLASLRGGTTKQPHVNAGQNTTSTNLIRSFLTLASPLASFRFARKPDEAASDHHSLLKHPTCYNPSFREVASFLAMTRVISHPTAEPMVGPYRAWQGKDQTSNFHHF